MSSILYEINTPVFLHKMSEDLGFDVKLDSIPDEYFKDLSRLGVEYVWFMGIWQRSAWSRRIGLEDEQLMRECKKALPDFTDVDFIGSAYAIQDYTVPELYGGEQALILLRDKLHAHGMKLLLDFVPNHTAPDHPWVNEHPDYYVQGSEQELNDNPDFYIRVSDSILANGRDPQFPAWTDVVQLNAFSAEYRAHVVSTLDYIARLCDGVRCDMAMLMMNDVFSGTWQERAGQPLEHEFWEDIITQIKEAFPEFLFIAEVYWNLEEDLLQLGFDYAYDKEVLDAIATHDNHSYESRLTSTAPYRDKLVVFLENHDELRIATLLNDAMQEHWAIRLKELPGLWLIHDGQLEGFKTKLPVHIGRGQREPVNLELFKFYKRLLHTNS